MENITASFDINVVTTPQTEGDEHMIPFWRQVMWISLFWCIVIAGTIGNSVVIWNVVAHKNMRTVTNIFLLNLAVADGLLACLNIPFVSYQLVFAYWPFGWNLCKLNEFIAATSVCVSVLTLSMIAFDRYTAVMYPFKRRMRLSKTITIIILIWVVSIVGTIPNWLYITTVNMVDGSFTCTQVWPPNSPQTIYRVVFMIMTYFLPLLCMTFSYGRMGAVLWGSRSIGEKTKSQKKKDVAKQKIVKMMIMVVAIFTICWLPFHLFFIMNSIGLLAKAPMYILEVYYGAFWLAMSNSMYNSMVYCWMNARFRAGFKKAFRWCPCVTYDKALYEIYFTSIAMRKSTVTDVE